MRLLWVLAFLLMNISIGHSQSREATICYFSFNNPKEFHYAKDLADRLNKQTGHNIKVIEYLPQGENPETAFERMVQQNAKCDGLVISGHHYGAWEGARADGTLNIDFLEKVSCDPRYKNWFKQIKALHLQGCRTLGVGVIAPNEVGQAENTPDFHTSRVNRVREADSIELGVMEMNHEFTNTLSQDNPLAARYLRVFPRATTFGWTKSAPGENSQSELSLLYHIAHMANVNDYLGRDVMVDPIKQLTDRDAIELSMAWLDMVQKPDWDHCENTAIAAWKNHGTPIRNKGYGYSNPDLNAYPSFESTNDPDMVRAKELGCKLKFPRNHAERIETLKEILKDRKLIAANFSAITEMVQDPQYLTSSQRTQVLSMLKENNLLQSYVGDKSTSPQTGLFAKIDYYSFYKKVFEKSSADIERIITDQSLEVLLKPYPSYDGRNPSVEVLDLRDFKATLTSSLAKNHFLSEEFMQRLHRAGTPMAKEMFVVLYNKLMVASTQAPHLRPMVEKLKPIRDSL